MTWGAPAWLWALLMPALAIGWILFQGLLRDPAKALAWPKLARWRAGVGTIEPVTGAGKLRSPWFCTLACAMAIFALARPQWGELERPMPTLARDVVVALDISRSMLTPDVAPNRLMRARLLVESLIASLEGERVALVVFSGSAFVQSPLSPDYTIFRELLREVGPEYMPIPGTHYGEMLRAVLEAFSGSVDDAERYLVLISDGEASDENWQARLPALLRKNIRVVALGVGTPEGNLIPDGEGGFLRDARGAVVLSRLEDGTLRELASASGGIYREAGRTWVDIPGLLKQAGFDKNPGQTTGDGVVIQKAERYQLFLGLALFLFMLGFYREMPARVRRRTIRYTSVLIVLVGFGWNVLEAVAPGGQTGMPEPSSAEVLAQAVARASSLTPWKAPDMADVAEATIGFGRNPASHRHPQRSQILHDGIRAAATGRAIDPDWTDWQSLAEELLALLEEKPPSSEAANEPAGEDSSESGPEQDEQNPENGSGNGQPSGRDGSSSEDTPKTGEDPGQKNGMEDKRHSNREEEANGEEARQEPDAGEEGNNGSDSRSHTPQDREVGGSAASEMAPGSEDPALAASWQKLQRLRDRDQPARLFHRLQDHPPSPTTGGQTW